LGGLFWGFNFFSHWGAVFFWEKKKKRINKGERGPPNFPSGAAQFFTPPNFREKRDCPGGRLGGELEPLGLCPIKKKKRGAQFFGGGAKIPRPARGGGPFSKNGLIGEFGAEFSNFPPGNLLNFSGGGGAKKGKGGFSSQLF